MLNFSRTRTQPRSTRSMSLGGMCSFHFLFTFVVNAFFSGSIIKFNFRERKAYFLNQLNLLVESKRENLEVYYPCPSSSLFRHTYHCCMYAF